MRSRTHQRAAAAGGLLLLALHLDFWRPQRAVLWFGWLPEELLWRLAWMAGAALFVVYLTRCLWRSGDGDAPALPGEDAEDGA